MSKKEVQATETGFVVTHHPAHVEKIQKATSHNQQDRIEAKLDMILDHLGVKVHE